MRDSFSTLAGWNWEGFLSLTALGFSIYVFMTQRWANREARVEVRYEEVRHVAKWSKGLTPGSWTRWVITRRLAA